MGSGILEQAEKIPGSGFGNHIQGFAPGGGNGFDLPFVVQGPWDDPLIFPDPESLIRRSPGAAPLQAMVAAMGDAVVAGKNPLERIRAMARAYVAFGVSHPDEYAFVFMQRRPHAPNESARVQHGDPAQDPYAFARGLFVDWAATGAVSTDDVHVAFHGLRAGGRCRLGSGCRLDR